MRDPLPQNAAEVAAADQNLAQARGVVFRLVAVADDARAAGCSPVEQFVSVGLRAADASVECPPGQQEGYVLGLLAVAVIALADARREHADADR